MTRSSETRGHGHTHLAGVPTVGRPRRAALIGTAIGLATIAALFAIDAWAPQLFPSALPSRAQDGFTLALSVLIESLPFIILGVLLSVVVQVWVPPGLIERWMPRRAWARRAVLSTREGARSVRQGARSAGEDAGARPVALIATGVGAVLASGLVVLAVVMPPASLSAELALARSSGAPPVLSTSATLALATSDDTSAFGIAEWASLLSTTTDPARFVGEKATLTGFVGPDGDSDGFALTRLVIVHCVIDAQAANVPVAELAGGEDLSPGQWVEVEGEFVRDDGGALVLQPASVTAIDEPGDPYGY
ncbi:MULTISPECIES: TIGR03943 family putative permease subunit [Bacteria]